MTVHKISLALLLLIVLAACGGYSPPEPIELPGNSIERAAVLGLQTSYRDSTMWEIQKARVLSVTPAAPTAAVLQDYDPKELYCVCLEYEARYKVTWTTTDPSPWERTVRNLLVMKTQSDAFMAARPMNICAPLCE
ncbi:MAG: hypothetical protein LBV79_00535 [Candidatus Adiutrix sp.]|jgi:hypothetical protein|nr:hypothetical protein [Candidatus Adiutrix sp.]